MPRNVVLRVLSSALGESFFDLLAPGLYAWCVTVAWPLSQRFAPLGSRLCAGAALIALLSGAVVARFFPIAARIGGPWVFVASCVGAWALFPAAVAPSHLDPVQGVLGSLGWALFAIAWGGQKTAAPPPPPGEGATPGAAKRPPARLRTILVLCLIVASAMIPIALSWWVEGIERALLAHAVSLAAAIAMAGLAVDLLAPAAHADADPVTLAAAVATSPSKRSAAAAPTLLALVALALAGAAYRLLR